MCVVAAVITVEGRFFIQRHDTDKSYTIVFSRRARAEDALVRRRLRRRQQANIVYRVDLCLNSRHSF